MSDWHAKDIDDALREVKSSREGISEEESSKRLLEFGRNEIRVEKRVSPLKILAKQFAQFLIVILLIASIISILLGEITDALVIFVIVIGSALLGFTQEFRAERAVEALKKMTASQATVLRNSREMRIPSSDVVRGDILIVSAGDKIAADARLIDAYNLKLDESVLTGESNTISKEIETLPSEKILAERVNMLYSGTVATYGRAKGIVVATGMGTEFGRIAGFLQTVEEVKTPLERRIGTLGRWIGLSSLVVVSIISILGIVRGNSLIEVFLFGVSLAVAAVPEALPAIVTGSLAVSVRAMARRKAIVKRLPAVETLGSTTIICSDKTGTLTKGEMTVRRIYDGEKFHEVTGVGYEPKGEISEGFNLEMSSLLKIAVLSNDANLVKEKGQDGNTWRIDGDPTEGSLIVLGVKAGLEKKTLESQYPRIWEIPFSSERKMMTTIHQYNGKKVAYVKGAPEVILNRCEKIASNLEIVKLGDMERKRILGVNGEMASSGLRVLAMAYRNLDPQLEEFSTAIEDDLTFAGLVGMIDPPREEVKGAVSICKQAGIKVVMITGDHKLTATSVAKELGIYQDGAIMTGGELENVSEDEFESEVERIEVYARVSPEHKIRIVRALKKRGHIVAMTGDGVNDAPALKGSDIGVAMGITGTEVSKEASDMILLDDNFATLIAAVERGRATYDNIKKYLVFLLSANGGEILIMFAASLIGFPLPLLPVQILFINLATDGLPAIALGIDPPGKDLMKMKPRDPSESIFRNTKGWIFGISALFGLVALMVFSFYLGTAGLDKARSMLFATMIIFELAFAFSARSQRLTLVEIGPLSNKYLVMAVASQVFLLFIIIYTPTLQEVFHVIPLMISDWIVVAVAGLSGFAIPEVSKVFTRRIRR